MTGTQDSIRKMLAMKTVAIVGLSDRPDRPSHEVAEFLQQHGFRIVPVNPRHARERILGEPCHASLQEAAAAIGAQGGCIDWVDIFRRPEDTPPVVADALPLARVASGCSLASSTTPRSHRPRQPACWQYRTAAARSN